MTGADIVREFGKEFDCAIIFKSRVTQGGCQGSDYYHVVKVESDYLMYDDNWHKGIIAIDSISQIMQIKEGK